MAQETSQVKSAIEAQYRATRLDIAQALKDLTVEHHNKECENLLAQKLTDLSLQQESMRTEQAILDSLYSPQAEERCQRIAKAHCETFDWIFKVGSAAPISDRLQNECNFASWLSHGAGLYWISGKPGSGKSTLMKYISRDVRTRQCLDVWAGSSNLITASFYFWNAGSRVQRSLLGLLRTLFFKILTANPALIAELFPWRWRVSQRYEASVHDWAEHEFLEALRVLKTRVAPSFDCKF